MNESDVEGIMTSKTVRTIMNYTLDNGRAPNFYFYKPDPSEKKNLIQPEPTLEKLKLRMGGI